MLYATLGDTELRVSRLCLGTMTWGQQNSEAEAHAQLDYAVAHGINFIDTAELYPVPAQAATQGRTEHYIGNWLRQHGQRDQLILATKAVGPGDWVSHIRSNAHFTRRQLRQAVEGSLRRLQTDYIDLYQLHWPDRQTNYFGQLGYTHPDEETGASIHETLQALAELVAEGKLRYIGVSNETPWGVMRFLQLAREHHLPRVQSIQNPYNLLNRIFEINLAEVAHREQVGLLAYSPLGFGVLSGKYLTEPWPPSARLSLFKQYTRYLGAHAQRATRAYVELARQHGLDPAQMALAFVNSRPFLTSTIIGATTLDQLKTNIASIELELDPATLEGIERIHAELPNPCP